MVVCAYLPMCDLAGDGHDTGAFPFGIVESVDSMQCGGSHSTCANADGAGQDRLAIGDIGRIFLMRHANLFKAFVSAHCFQKGVERISGHAENLTCARLRQHVQ